jgi:hypothetical protein
MPPAQPARTLQLRFISELFYVALDLSAARIIDQILWLGSDETAHLEKLTLQEEAGVGHESIPVNDFLNLPHGDEQEIDIEGIAYSDHYLWVVGSHSLKRKRVKLDEYSPDENIQRLETLSMEENRYLLGRIPLVNGQLFKSCSHPTDPSKVLRAGQLKREKHGNQLTRSLRDDDHLREYLRANIPGKENGFDIEGIAVAADRIFLGLRGPVLRGWAVLLEVQVKEKKSGDLRLKKIGPDGERYRKHFLNLRGEGIRDLCFYKEDLLVLSGPTMDITGDTQIFRIPQALATLEAQSLIEPEPIFTVPGRVGADKAEGMTLVSTDEPAVLIVYDAPHGDRTDPEKGTVVADVFNLPLG